MGYIGRFRKSLKYIFFIAVTVYIVWLLWLALGFYLVKSNYKQTVYHVPVKSHVAILRDDHAIPLIKTESKQDALFGLGFVHAQDRYWQLMILRETAKGHLAGHFGSDFINHDRYMKTLDLEGIAKTTYIKQSPQTKTYLQTYADGINAWQSEHKGDFLPLTPESFIFQINFEPWQPEDSILIQKFMHYTLTDKASQSLSTMWLIQHISDNQINDVLPGIKLPKNTLWPKINSIANHQQKYSTGASNAFAVDGPVVLSGKSLLSSDVHLRWTAPSLWLLVSMQWGDHFVTGGTIPGMPAIFVGRNNHLAWGVTMTGADDQDVNIIQLDDDNRYQSPTGKKSLKTRQIDIKVKNGNDFSETVLSTPEGPIIDPVFYGFKLDPQDNAHFIIQWTGLNTDDQYFDFQWSLMDMQSVDELNDAFLEKITAPNMNLMVADDSKIKMVVTGKLPKRNPMHPTQGRYPGDFSDIKTHWEGFFSIKDNPVFEAKQGVLVNTNNRITTADFPKHIAFNWIDRYRIRRVDEMISNTDVMDQKTLKKMQVDVTSYRARWLNSLLLYHLDDAKVSAHYKPLLAAIQIWQGNMNEHGFQPLFYHVWLSAFKKRLYQPIVGEHGRDIEILNATFLESLLKDPKIQKNWCQSDCSEVVNLAFNDAIKQMEQQFGDDYEGWQWGRLHSAKHKHTTLGDMPIIGLIANIQHPISGDLDTLAMAASDDENSFYTAVRGSGLRTLIDFSEGNDVIHMVNATGQSGHLLSKFYRDQNHLWRQGEYIVFDPNHINVKYQTDLYAN